MFVCVSNSPFLFYKISMLHCDAAGQKLFTVDKRGKGKEKRKGFNWVGEGFN